MQKPNTMDIMYTVTYFSVETTKNHWSNHTHTVISWVIENDDTDVVVGFDLFMKNKEFGAFDEYTFLRDHKRCTEAQFISEVAKVDACFDFDKATRAILASSSFIILADKSIEPENSAYDNNLVALASRGVGITHCTVTVSPADREPPANAHYPIEYRTSECNHSSIIHFGLPRVIPIVRASDEFYILLRETAQMLDDLSDRVSDDVKRVVVY
jgi:hypothetical protein